MKKGTLKRHARMLLAFLLWLVLVTFLFATERAELTGETAAVAGLALAVWLLIGFCMDRSAQRAKKRRLDRIARERAELGEQAWLEQEAKRDKEQKRWKKQLWTGVLVDVAMGGVYLALTRLSCGEGTEWIKIGIPRLLGFLLVFLVPAIWLGGLPGNLRKKGKAFEFLILWPLFLLPFSPLFSFRSERQIPACIVLFLGYEFFLMGAGYQRQVRKKRRTCTVMTTGKVVENVAGRMRSPGESGGSVPTYQPVVEYYAAGETRRVTCDDGQPRPLPVGLVTEIYYDPGHPEEFRFGETQKTFTESYGGAIFMGVGILILIFGACLWAV